MAYSIDSSEFVELNGINQSVRIRSNGAHLPVLLFLHGGPGVCNRHTVMKDQAELLDIATIVCWDQAGSGKSWSKSIKKSDLTVDRMVEDANALVLWLCKKFGKEKIAIVGHSWGSLLGTLLAKRHPEHIAFYIGIGQFVDGDENEALSYEFVVQKAKETGNKKAMKQLAAIGAPIKGHYPSRKALMVQRDWMTKFGGGTYKGRDSIVSSILMPLLKSKEYNLADIYRFAKGSYFSLDALWNEVVDFDLSKDVPSLEVPIYLTEGRYDRNTPIPIAERWFEKLEAPRKRWYFFDHSAHSPLVEEPEAWNARVREIFSIETALETL